MGQLGDRVVRSWLHHILLKTSFLIHHVHIKTIALLLRLVLLLLWHLSIEEIKLHRQYSKCDEKRREI